MPLQEQNISHFKTLAGIKIPRIMRVISLFLLLTFIVVIVFLISVPWVQTTLGTGVVTALNPSDRQQNINALVSGRIEKWFVRDGDLVKMGDQIARIVDNDPELIERLKGERTQVRKQLQAAQNGLRTAQLDQDRMKSLYESGLVARREYEQTQIRVETFNRSVAETSATLSRMNVNLTRQSVQTVTAPRDGVILSINAGDASTYVSTGDVLATFVPNAPERVIEIFVGGRDIALVQIGAKTKIQFEAWPAVQFSGWPSVAIGTFDGIVINVDPSAQPDGRFRILVSEDPEAAHSWPEERYVRIGAKVRAWVLLETVSVGYEMWRQLNNFPPELTMRPEN